jgi:phage-related minor tail protein
MSSEAINSKREENFVKEIERQKSWAAGWDQAFKRYSETAERASLRGEAAFQSVVSNMETALRTFVETGKLNFKDFVGSVIKDLLYMEMKAQATMIFRQIWGSITASFGPSTIGTLGGKASGGYIDRASIVGENGPELFIPRTPGTIIPNGSWQQMANSGGGGLTVNGNYIANMSAIDTQSATQFLASNKQTIWAAYQSANRMVPISR